MGNEDYAQNLGKFNDQRDADYQTISIEAARRLGILPIAFDASEKFQAVRPQE
jgi:hypothetical protein